MGSEVRRCPEPRGVCPGKLSQSLFTEAKTSFLFLLLLLLLLLSSLFQIGSAGGDPKDCAQRWLLAARLCSE